MIETKKMNPMRLRPISESIILEEKNIQKLFKKILISECNFLVKGNFFYHTLLKKYFYFSLQFFTQDLFSEHITLGEFSYKDKLIHLNLSAWLHLNQDQKLNVLRHEFAHYLLYLENHLSFFQQTAHGEEFKKICEKYGWSKVVAKATLDLLEIKEKLLLHNKSNQQSISKESKIKKLLSLSHSPNRFEAELALLKAQEMINESQIEYLKQSQSLHSEWHHYQYAALEVVEQCRLDAKLKCLRDLMECFSFKAILKYKEKAVALEIVGHRETLSQAPDIFHFLKSQIENWWLEEKKRPHQNGKPSKSNFFAGISHGFQEKMRLHEFELSKLQEAEQSSEIQLAKMNMNLELEKHFHICYRRLSSIKSTFQINRESFSSGAFYGKRLELKEKFSTIKTSLLSFWGN